MAAPTALAASVWWVDNSSPSLCSDTGPGSATPFCTISAAAKKAVSAGDQVMVRPGTYAEQVNVAASGTTGSPITFTASAPGVVVLGSRDLSDAPGWAPTTTTAWSRVYAPPSAPRLQLQVFSDGLRLLQAASLAALGAGQFFYDTVSKVLYVDAGGANPCHGAHDRGVRGRHRAERERRSRAPQRAGGLGDRSSSSGPERTAGRRSLVG